jgi:hypothetical protein
VLAVARSCGRAVAGFRNALVAQGGRVTTRARASLAVNLFVAGDPLGGTGQSVYSRERDKEGGRRGAPRRRCRAEG